MWRHFIPRVLILVCKRSHSIPYRLADILGTGSYECDKDWQAPARREDIALSMADRVLRARAFRQAAQIAKGRRHGTPQKSMHGLMRRGMTCLPSRPLSIALGRLW